MTLTQSTANRHSQHMHPMHRAIEEQLRENNLRFLTGIVGREYDEAKLRKAMNEQDEPEREDNGPADLKEYYDTYKAIQPMEVM